MERDRVRDFNLHVLLEETRYLMFTAADLQTGAGLKSQECMHVCTIII